MKGGLYLASSIIHVAVCNELNKKLKRDQSKLLIGTIAPDISKLVGESKVNTHFLDSENTNIPNLYKFLNKYKYYLDDDFVLGYYIHLYTDYLWFKYFMAELVTANCIRKIDGEIVNCDKDTIAKYIYNDYTNLNKDLVNYYNIDLGFLYDKIPKIDNIIEEAHTDKIDLIISKSREIYENSKKEKSLVFNMDNVNNFITLSVSLINSNLQDLNIL